MIPVWLTFSVLEDKNHLVGSSASSAFLINPNCIIFSPWPSLVKQGSVCLVNLQYYPQGDPRILGLASLNAQTPFVTI